MVLRIALAAAMAVFMTVSGATAGEGLLCEAVGAEVSVHVPLGGGVGLSPLGVELVIDTDVWSSDPARATKMVIVPSQSYGTETLMQMDFSDDNAERTVARLQLVVAYGEEGPVFGGTLWIEDTGAWAVTCY